MTDNPKWTKDAVIEVFEVLYPEYSIHQDMLDEATTIISKHCPEGKAGKLVEALKDIASTNKRMVEFRGAEDTIKYMVDHASAALAEYEKVNK